MTTESATPKQKKKRLFLKIFLGFTLVLIAIGAYLYNNYNRLLADALMNSFNSNIISDVYELKFKKLRVDLFAGNIAVIDVEMRPREKPLNDYPYINSSFVLKTHKISLSNVRIMMLLKQNQLELDRIEIIQPEIDLKVGGDVKILFPVKDTTVIKKQNTKKFVDSYALKSFQLKDASFHVMNSYEEREFKISDFNISIHDLLIGQLVGRDILTYQEIEWKIGKFEGVMNKGPVRKMSFKDYSLKIDSLGITKTLDTIVFKYDNFTASIRSVDVLTRDSVFSIHMNAFDLDSKDKSIKIEGILFAPNISYAALQRKFKYQHTDFSANIGKLSIVNLNFDSLIYERKILIDEIVIDSVVASIFKDNTKPFDKDRIPSYFGQQIMAIPLPLTIKQLKVTGVNLENTERKKDSAYAKVRINRGTVLVENITNQSPDKTLTMSVNAFIENKVPFSVRLGFSYSLPQFSLNGKFERFALPEMNPVLLAYTPAKVDEGIADEINFSGTVYKTYASGKMKFLYHDLDVDLQLQNKAKWKSSVGAFAANTFVKSSNPPSADLPPKIVTYRVERDMHKGFINIIIKSALSGLKETVFMSKENRKEYKKQKKKAREKN